MKTYRQREKQGSKVQDSNKGPDETKIKVNKIVWFWSNMPLQPCSSGNVLVFFCVFQALLERTGYTLDVTTGQRKYGGPPPEDVFKGTQPGIGTEVYKRFLSPFLRLWSFGQEMHHSTIVNLVLYILICKSFHISLPHQVFVGKIPRDLYEDELVPLFESAGAIWDLRLMMDPLSGQNRGYAFITYCNKDDAQKAVKLVSSILGYCKKHQTIEQLEYLTGYCWHLKIVVSGVLL